jgi:flap endonuclease-1
VKGVGPKTALKLMREHGSLAKVVEFIQAKMKEKADEQAALDAEEESEAESEEGGDMIINSDGEEEPAPKKAAPKKKKKVSSGMQIPEYWPWEEAKKLFVSPDVVKGPDLEVRKIVPNDY